MKALIHDLVFVLVTADDDRRKSQRPSDVPEFTEALAVAEEALSTGTIPWEQFSKCCSSAEVDCINQTFEAGRPVGGGTMSPPVLMRLSNAPGFEDWYQRLRSKVGHETERSRPWWRFWR